MKKDMRDACPFFTYFGNHKFFNQRFPDLV